MSRSLVAAGLPMVLAISAVMATMALVSLPSQVFPVNDITSAGTVTSAAIVMVGVFATFATLTLIDMKEMGIGLAAAVLIDATVIRGVLLPATLKLLGDATWYMPKGLSRVRRARRAEPHAEPAKA